MPLKFSSKSIEEHPEVPLADEGRWDQLVEQWTARAAGPARDVTGPGSNAVYVVSVGPGCDAEAEANAQLAEIVSLVRHQGDRVVGEERVRVARPNPKTLLGKGATLAIAARARGAGATMIVLDAELTPSQARNLEDALGLAVSDREAVILNVFRLHARTRRARVQVEIARLEYLRPRIRGVGLDMDQQVGGMARARGPGETASELLARKLDTRLSELGKVTRRLGTSADTQRRERANAKRIALVGYTNAGKTSLMNALTAADLSARDVPFETLDTTARSLSRHGGDVVISDTVGFIRRLPERLLASFDSTLAEVREASLLAVVIDASDPEREMQLATTKRILERLGASAVPRMYVWNKIDRLRSLDPLDELQLDALSDGVPWRAVSSHDAVATAALGEALLAEVRGDEEELVLFVPYRAASVLQMVYGKCRLSESVATDTGLRLTFTASKPVAAQIARALREVS
jgi:GTP-binding protein HflX